KEPLRFAVILSRRFVEMLGAETEEIPRIKCLRRLPFRQSSFGIPNLGFDPGSDRCCNVILYLKYVLKLTVVLFCPDLLPAFCLHQLRRNPHARPNPADTTSDNVVGAEVAPNMAGIAAASHQRKR